MERTDKFKHLLEDKRGHTAIGRSPENGEPFLFCRLPGKGGVLHQSLGGGNVCYVLYISEDGEIENIHPVYGKDFKSTARFLLETVNSPNIDSVMSDIAEMQAAPTREEAEVTK